MTPSECEASLHACDLISNLVIKAIRAKDSRHEEKELQRYVAKLESVLTAASFYLESKPGTAERMNARQELLVAVQRIALDADGGGDGGAK